MLMLLRVNLENSFYLSGIGSPMDMDADIVRYYKIVNLSFYLLFLCCL